MRLFKAFRGSGFLTFAGVSAILAASWLHVVSSSVSASSVVSNAVMPMNDVWSTADFGAAFAMWTAMMFAMMTPSALPMIRIYSKVVQKRKSERREAAPVWVFAAGYAFAWVAFSAAAAALQGALIYIGIFSMSAGLVNSVTGGIILVAGGIYQFSPLKNSCLKKCQSPLDFITENWKEGYSGTAGMGLKHGAYCIGCCWLLMGILFAAGLMNLLWIAIITAFVFAEKNLMRFRWATKAGGLGLMLWGGWLLLTAILNA
ncbi:MAG: DUF2182 domain-containing protein [Candidatus Aenigmarchaeota archaeon]|nr:DUF2182 domain-containing protein [Candidatus Aenigmarchaeota archaeon]